MFCEDAEVEKNKTAIVLSFLIHINVIFLKEKPHVIELGFNFLCSYEMKMKDNLCKTCFLKRRISCIDMYNHFMKFCIKLKNIMVDFSQMHFSR